MQLNEQMQEENIDSENLVQKLRMQLNGIDDRLVATLAERHKLSCEIIEAKIDSGLAVEDFERERAILDRLEREYTGVADPKLFRAIYNAIFTSAKNKYKPKEAFYDVRRLINAKPLIIAGPCTVESYDQINSLAEKLSEMGVLFMRGGAYKPRTSPYDFQGLGVEGLDLLLDAACTRGMYTVTEILDAEALEENYDKIDVIQIGSRNMSAYGFLKQVGKFTRDDNKPVILKRGFSATITELLNAGEYIINEGNPNVVFCLRGIRTFEQIDSKFRNTPDLAAILELKDRTDKPVIFDPSHAAGDSKYVLPLAKAALNLGADGLMIEVHDNPEDALVDGRQAVSTADFEEFLKNEIL